MDAYLALVSRRDVKRYAARAIGPESVHRILDAGRLAGSARNRQPWRFLVVESEAMREAVAEAVYVPENVRTAGLVVVVACHGRGGFDCGRAAQSMLLAAWSEGIASSPNGFRDREAAASLLGLDEGWEPAAVLTFGYPAGGTPPEQRTAEEWSARANRLPLDEVVRRI